MIDLVATQAEIEIDGGNLAEAKALLEELKQLTRKHQKPDMVSEATYLVAKLFAKSKDVQRATTLFLKVQKLAHDQHKLRLKRLCKQNIEALMVTN